MIKILLAEDDRNFGAVLRDYLALHDYEVQLCADGVEAWETFCKQAFDLCILDVMMPNKDGFSLAHDIRERDQEVPLFFLTARGLKEDVLKGFRLGADDYISKPFDAEVLLFKIKAVLGRQQKKPKPTVHSFLIGDYSFDVPLRQLKRDAAVRVLTPREADLLQMLCVHMNEVMPRELALKNIWKEDNYFTARSMDVYIARLRKYFKDDPTVEIMNLHQKGFRLYVKNTLQPSSKE